MLHFHVVLQKIRPMTYEGPTTVEAATTVDTAGLGLGFALLAWRKMLAAPLSLAQPFCETFFLSHRSPTLAQPSPPNIVTSGWWQQNMLGKGHPAWIDSFIACCYG